MMAMIPETYWQTLKNSFDDPLVLAVSQAFASPDLVAVTVENLGSELEVKSESIRELLERLVTDGMLKARDERYCSACKARLTSDDEQLGRCYCGVSLSEAPLPKTVRAYVREGGKSRDVRWVVTVHGMNTPGEWQQTFSWRLAKLYGYAVPVGIFKYGNIKFGPLIPFRQRHHRDKLLKYLHRLRDEMKADGYGERCDVIAHSFGTWLFAQALLADQSTDPIKVGRVVLTGSIVRPDFDWRPLLENRRVEAVLCHYGGRDLPVRMSQYFIPESGPSGRYGFNDQAAIIHKYEPTFDHSAYFIERNLSDVMRDKWAPFLTWPPQALACWQDAPNALARNPWSASKWRWLTQSIKAVVLFALTLCAALAISALWLGIPLVVAELP